MHHASLINKFAARAVAGAVLMAALLAGASPANAAARGCQVDTPPVSLTHTMSPVELAAHNANVYKCQQASNQVSQSSKHLTTVQQVQTGQSKGF
jgi:hypothetical protein